MRERCFKIRSYIVCKFFYYKQNYNSIDIDNKYSKSNNYVVLATKQA